MCVWVGTERDRKRERREREREKKREWEKRKGQIMRDDRKSRMKIYDWLDKQILTYIDK